MSVFKYADEESKEAAPYYGSDEKPNPEKQESDTQPSPSRETASESGLSDSTKPSPGTSVRQSKIV